MGNCCKEEKKVSDDRGQPIPQVVGPDENDNMNDINQVGFEMKKKIIEGNYGNKSGYDQESLTSLEKDPSNFILHLLKDELENNGIPALILNDGFDQKQKQVTLEYFSMGIDTCKKYFVNMKKLEVPPPNPEQQDQPPQEPSEETIKENIKNGISNGLGTQKENVYIDKFQIKGDHYEFYVLMKGVKIPEDQIESLKNTLKISEIKEFPLLDGCILSNEYLDKSANKAQSDWGGSVNVGGEEFQPPINYYGFGLNTDKMYYKLIGNAGGINKVEENEWKSDSTRNWAFAYIPLCRKSTKIYGEHTPELKEDIELLNTESGLGRYYKDTQNKRDMSSTCGDGLYYTSNIELAERLSKKIKFHGNLYKVILMVKVNKNEIREPVSSSRNEELGALYIADAKRNQVRPFKILVRQIEGNEFDDTLEEEMNKMFVRIDTMLGDIGEQIKDVNNFQGDENSYKCEELSFELKDKLNKLKEIKEECRYFSTLSEENKELIKARADELLNSIGLLKDKVKGILPGPQVDDSDQPKLPFFGFKPSDPSYRLLKPSEIEDLKGKYGECTPEDKFEIDNNYCGTCKSFQINKNMRLNWELTSGQQKTYDSLRDTIFTNEIKEKFILFRYVDKNFFSEYNIPFTDTLVEAKNAVNKIFIDATPRELKKERGFCSTSYGNNEFTYRQILLVIYAEEENYSYFTDNDCESEVILPNNLCFEFFNCYIKEVDGKNRLVIETKFKT